MDRFLHKHFLRKNTFQKNFTEKNFEKRVIILYSTWTLYGDGPKKGADLAYFAYSALLKRACEMFFFLIFLFISPFITLNCFSIMLCCNCSIRAVEKFKMADFEHL